MKTILVVDDNFGFLFWLGNTLKSARYNVVPAGSVQEAQTLLEILGVAADLLIINPALSEAAEFVGVLRSDRPGVGVLAAIEGSDGLAEPGAVAADRVARKPPVSIDAEIALGDETHDPELEANLRKWRAEWLGIVRAALEGRATSAD